MSGGEWVLAAVLGASAFGFAMGFLAELARDRRADLDRQRAAWRDVAERERARARLSELGQRERRP